MGTRPTPQRGFTIIELMIAIAVLGILVTIAIPGMGDLLDRRRVIGAAEAVQSEIRFARSEAIKQSRDMTVTIDPDGTWITIESNDGVIKTLTGEAFTDTITLDPGDLEEIRFDNVRGLATGTGSLTLESGRGRQIVVTVNLLGRVSLCSPSGSANVSGYAECQDEEEEEGG